MSEKSFIVPHDFTPVADIALEHAIATAKPLKAEVQLVHVVQKKIKFTKRTKNLHQSLKSMIRVESKLFPM